MRFATALHDVAFDVLSGMPEHDDAIVREHASWANTRIRASRYPSCVLRRLDRLRSLAKQIGRHTLTL